MEHEKVKPAIISVSQEFKREKKQSLLPNSFPKNSVT